MANVDGAGSVTAVGFKHGFLLPLCPEGVLQYMKQVSVYEIRFQK